MFSPKPLSAPVKFELLKAGYRNIPTMVIVTMALAMAMANFTQHRYEDMAWYWFAIVSVVSLIRIVSWYSFHTEQKKQTIAAKDYKHWYDQYGFWLNASGLLWAFMACYIIAHNNLELIFCVAVIISGLAGGASAVTAPMLRAGQIYISLLLLPAAITIVMSGYVEITVGAFGFLFWAAMQHSLNGNNVILTNSLVLKFENSALVGELKDLNDNLEQQVAERTADLRHMAHYDALTQLMNRSGLEAWMAATCVAHPLQKISVLFIDLDRFKQVNDVMGQHTGDQLLIQAGEHITRDLPPSGAAARWSGDEYIVLLPQTEDGLNPHEFGRAVIDALSCPFDINGEPITLGASVGLAYYPDDGKTLQAVVQAADLAVAEAKRADRGSLMDYDQVFSETQVRRFNLARDLKVAIETQALTLHYQPIIDVKTGHVASMEALARWQHPTLGPISPDQFIRLAEDFDMIGDLGLYILKQACYEAASWPDKGFEQAKIAVNVSIKQLIVDGFCYRVFGILAKSGLAPQRLIIEVTESLFDDDNIDIVLETTKSLKALGVEIDIDDFGTGYSSLSRLSKFPVNAIKIDRCFVTNAHTDGRVIIESAVMMARRFGFKIIAEGIESLDQAKLLSELGIDYFQGYYFGKPQSAPELKAHATGWLLQAPLPVRRLRRKADF